MARTPKATIGDVARLAGVSRATVSRVLNGTATVTPDKVKAVRDAVEAMSFTVSTSARNLATGRSNSVAVILTEPIEELLSDPTYATVLKGVMDGLLESEMTPSLYMMATEREREKGLALFRRGAADAIIHLSPYTEDHLLDDLVEVSVPVVLCGQIGARYAVESAFSKVYSDDVVGARALGEHLRERGAKSVVALMGPADNPATVDRVNGFREALGDVLADAVLYGGWDDVSGEAQARQLLDRGVTFDAVACGNDRIAAGVVRVFELAGVDVPASVMVTGFDDHAMASEVRPPLTTVRQPFYLQGKRAVALAQELVDGGEAREEVLPTDLVIRQSTSR